MYSYDPLWKTLIDKGMKKKDLVDKVGLARGTVTKMGKNEPVGINIIDRICNALDVDMSKVVSCGPDVQPEDGVFLTVAQENIGRPGHPEFRETIIERGDYKTCCEAEEVQRRLFRNRDPEGVMSEVSVISETEYRKRKDKLYPYT